jgi:hypothetical protein
MQQLTEPEQNHKEVAKVFLINRKSATVIIPREFAKHQGLTATTHVTIEETSEGILIKRINLQGDKK